MNSPPVTSASPSPAPHTPKSHLWSRLKWVLALGLLGLLIYWNRSELSQFRELKKDWSLVGVALLFCLLATLLTFLRWFLLVRVLDFPFRLRDALRLGFMGQLFVYAGPGLMGADVFKAFFLAKDNPGRRGIAASTVFLDRLLGMLSLFVVGAIASLFVPRIDNRFDWIIRVVLWGGSLSGILGVALLLQPFVTRNPLIQRLSKLPQIGHILMGILNGVAMYQSRPKTIVIALLIGVFSHALNFTGLFCCAWALDLGSSAPNYWSHLFLMPAAAFTSLLPVPGGIGPQEWVIQQLYAIRGKPSLPHGAGLWAALAFRMVNVAISSIGLAYYLPIRRQVNQMIEEIAPPPPEEA